VVRLRQQLHRLMQIVGDGFAQMITGPKSWSSLSEHFILCAVWINPQDREASLQVSHETLSAANRHCAHKRRGRPRRNPQDSKAPRCTRGAALGKQASRDTRSLPEGSEAFASTNEFLGATLRKSVDLAQTRCVISAFFAFSVVRNAD